VRLPCLWLALWNSWELPVLDRMWEFPCDAALTSLDSAYTQPPGGQSSPILSAGLSIARQAALVG
jgi:hypothetical protein